MFETFIKKNNEIISSLDVESLCKIYNRINNRQENQTSISETTMKILLTELEKINKSAYDAFILERATDPTPYFLAK